MNLGRDKRIANINDFEYRLLFTIRAVLSIYILSGNYYFGVVSRCIVNAFPDKP